MKSIIIGDNHWGIKSFSEDNFNTLLDYYSIIVIPYMNDNNIKNIIHMGDLFDNRVKMDINFLNMFIDKFIGLLKENNVKFTTIIGNHDIYFKNRNDISIVKYLPNFYDGITVINEPTEMIMDDKKVLLIPWLGDIDYTKYGEFNYIFGHFEMSGIFENLRGEISPDIFQGENIIKVFSGHYHNKSAKGKIQYVGTPYQTSWGDCGDIKGMWVLDTQSEDIKFIENNLSPKYIKVKYKESDDKPYCIQGWCDADKYFEDIDSAIKQLESTHHYKVFINDATTHTYIEDLYKFKNAGFNYDLFDNVELKNVTGIDVVSVMESEKTKNTEYTADTDMMKFIYDNIGDNDLLTLLERVKNVEIK